MHPDTFQNRTDYSKTQVTFEIYQDNNIYEKHLILFIGNCRSISQDILAVVCLKIQYWAHTP